MFDAVQGVEPQSETVWRQADRYNVPRICFINKMDRVGADFERSVDMIRTRLGANPVVMQIPLGAEAKFVGAIDLLEMRTITWVDQLGARREYGEIPEEYRDAANAARAAMIEKIAETDDELLTMYVEGTEPSTKQLMKALRTATIAVRIFPVYCGSALKNKGVQPMLDAVVDILPSPLDVPNVKGIDPRTGEEIERSPDPNAPMAALVFKIVTDPYVGRLAYFRVYSGKITAGSKVQNTTRDRRERIGRLIRMYADRREEVEEVSAGDIAATLGLKDTLTGETLADPTQSIVLESITFPDPVISVAIEPKTAGDQDKMSIALHKLSEEDPTFQVRSDENTGQTLISGMGELHLEVLVDRMLREFKVQANVGRPRVAYRESITKSVLKYDYRHVKQSGGHGQFAHVVLNLEPGEPGTGIEFEHKIVRGAIPREYIPAVESGIRAAAEGGILAGYPVTDIVVTLVDGSFHEVDSSSMAFEIAGSIGFKEAFARGAPVLLEPIMRAEIVMPEEYLGETLGDLSSRRGHIEGTELRPGGNTQSIIAMVPLAEMFGYATTLRSNTKGRGVFTMGFDHYQKVSKSVAEKVTL